MLQSIKSHIRMQQHGPASLPKHKTTPVKALICALSILFAGYNTGFAQPLTGTKTVGASGDYLTIAAAVTALNANGVGSGGVIFNVDADHTENISSPISITATGTLSNPITFQKNGGGANPLITRTDAGSQTTSGVGGQGDGIIVIEGSDYLTINGIDLAADESTIEYGYFSRKLSGTDGCKNVVIRDCSVTMNKGASGYVIGIYISNLVAASPVSSASGVTVTADGGKNENVSILNNTIRDVHYGIYFRGSSATGYFDSNNTVGAEGEGNTVENFGGGSATMSIGIHIVLNNGVSVAYNTIDNMASGGSAATNLLYGIYINFAGISGTNIVNENELTLNSGSSCFGINFYNATSYDVNILRITNNHITMTSAGSSATYLYFYANNTQELTMSGNVFAAGGDLASTTIYFISMPYTTTIASNNILNNSTSGSLNKTSASGNFYCYHNNSGTGTTEIVSGNTFSNITVTGSTIFYGFTSGRNYTTKTLSNNTLSNITGSTGGMSFAEFSNCTNNNVYGNRIANITSAGYVFLLRPSSSTTNAEIYDNVFENITTSGTYIQGIDLSVTGTLNMYRNRLDNWTITSSSSTLYGIYISSGTNTLSNNLITNFKAGAVSNANLNSFRAIHIHSTTSSTKLYYNTIYMNATSSGANFSSCAVYYGYSSGSSPTLEMRNNILVNTSAPNGTGKTAVFVNASNTSTYYNAASNNNCLYAGTPSATRVIYQISSTAYQSIANFKAAVSPKDNNSVGIDPVFAIPAGTNAADYSPTAASLNAAVISGYEQDYFSIARSASIPAMGAIEGNYFIWMGATNNSWDETSNWNRSAVPTSGADVIIPSTGVSGHAILSSPASVRHLIMENSTYGLQTGANTLTISGNLKLTAGRIEIGDEDLVLTNTATITGGGVNSFLFTGGEGSVVWEGCSEGQTKLFPVGHTNSTSGYTPIQMTFNSGHTTDDYSVRVINKVTQESTPAGTELTTDVVKATWYISESTSGGTNVDVRFQWNTSDEATDFDRSSIYVSHHNGSWWHMVGTTGSSAGSNPYSFTLDNYTGNFSPFAIGDLQATLPVSWNDFTAKALDDETALLTWKVSNEENIRHYEVEYLANGTYLLAGTVLPNAHGHLVKEYSFTHKPGVTGNVSYRIRQVDIDGRYNYSPVRMVNFRSHIKARVFPNPVQSSFTLVLGDQNRSLQKLIVADASGKIQITRTITGMDRVEVDMAGMKPGIYFLSVTGSGTDRLHFRVFRQ